MSKRITVYVFIVALAVAGTAEVRAQAADVSDHSAQVGWWKQNLGDQLAASLKSPVPAIQQQALQHVNYFAANADDEIDLAATVPALSTIYETAEHERMRIMALTALHAIGGETIAQYLRERVQQETSPRIRRLTLAAIADYDAAIL